MDDMDAMDDLARLRELVPAPAERHLTPTQLAERKQMLMTQIAAMGGADAPELAGRSSMRAGSRRWRRRVALAALVPAALIGATVAYSATAHRSAQQLGDQATCFAAPSLDAAAAGSPFTGQDLGAFCEQQWNAGSITWPVPGPAPTTWVACADSTAVDVFPGDDQGLCDRLGLQPLPPGYYEAVPKYAGLQSDLLARFADSTCFSADDAVRTVRQILDAHGYSTWTVDAHGFSDATPCARIDLDPVNGVASVIGWVRPELESAVARGLERAGYCGPADRLLGDVRQALSEAGFADWQVTIDHELTAQWPCVAGSNVEPGTKTVVLAGHATG